MCNMSELTCATCEYMKFPHEGLYCYMFRDKGSFVEEHGHCMQHTSIPRPTPAQARRNLMVACMAIMLGNPKDPDFPFGGPLGVSDE
jgi:hypothetical protein